MAIFVDFTTTIHPIQSPSYCLAVYCCAAALKFVSHHISLSSTPDQKGQIFHHHNLYQVSASCIVDDLRVQARLGQAYAQWGEIL